ncbi:hypothetical protein NIES932_20450 [Raphidiopsis curvata NIES-932]|nr:hypothetical protein NIES932_20450 [Raphidiopsis curvata NIES-932]
MERPYTAVLIIPTGIGATIGGYAGDAIPLARVMSQVCDRLITHPNVLNGASLYWNISNSYYVEGYGLDKFASGEWGLRPVRSNRIGVILDKAIEPDLMLRHLQTVDGARATLGLNIVDSIVTDTSLGVEIGISTSGISWGTISNPDSLLRAAAKLVTTEKVEAIAVVGRFPDSMGGELAEKYRQGKGVDPVAGAEALISHLLVRTFKIPCAHAPALATSPPELDLSPLAAAEEIGYTYMPSVLVGLSRAPQFITSEKNKSLPGDIWAEEIDAVISPAGACGGSVLMSLSQKQCQIVTVTGNETLITVPAASLGIKATQVSSYLEAIGVLAAHKAGVDPQALLRE